MQGARQLVGSWAGPAWGSVTWVLLYSTQICQGLAVIGGAAAGAGLTVGDLVESINGEKVTSSAQGATLLTSAVGEVKIIVTRPIPSSQKV